MLTKMRVAENLVDHETLYNSIGQQQLTARWLNMNEERRHIQEEIGFSFLRLDNS